MDIEQVGLELEEAREKLSEIKTLVEELIYLWETSSLIPGAEPFLIQLQDICEDIDL